MFCHAQNITTLLIIMLTLLCVISHDKYIDLINRLSFNKAASLPFIKSIVSDEPKISGMKPVAAKNRHM